MQNLKPFRVESFYLTHRERLLRELRDADPKGLKSIVVVPDVTGDGANVYLHRYPEEKAS